MQETLELRMGDAMKGLRKLRGALGMAVTWAAAAIPLGLLSTIIHWALNGEIYDFTDLEALSWQVSTWGATGVASGLIFAAAFAISERGREVSSVSPWRTALDGALAGGLGYYAGFFTIVGSSLRGDILRLLEGLAPSAAVSALIGTAIALGLRRIAMRGDEGEIRDAVERDATQLLSAPWPWDEDVTSQTSRAGTAVR